MWLLRERHRRRGSLRANAITLTRQSHGWSRDEQGNVAHNERRLLRKKWHDVRPALYIQNEQFVRDFLQKSHVKSPKRALRTRLPQKVTRHVSKTSLSYETSSKTHTSKSAKRAFRTRIPPKVKRKHPSEHTHHAALPCSFAIPAPPNNIRSHANPNVTATFTSTATHNLTIPCACHESFRFHTNAHKVLRLPRNVTSVTPLNLTIPCTCHENRTSTPQNPHKVLPLPRKVTISSHVRFNKICTTPHVWNDFDPF